MAWEATWAAGLLGGIFGPCSDALSAARETPSELDASLQAWLRAGAPHIQCPGKAQAGLWPSQGHLKKSEGVKEHWTRSPETASSPG